MKCGGCLFEASGHVGRAPHGARGLKFGAGELGLYTGEVAPHTGRVD